MNRRGVEYRVLDKDLRRVTNAETAQLQAARPLIAVGAALIFVAAVGLLALGVYGGRPDLAMIAAAMTVASYLALSIGSNDVANSLGPAVGAGAVPLLAGLLIVGVAEVAGALLAGGHVSDRLSAGIISPVALGDGQGQQAMMSALLAAAIWISLASWRALPVSTTHSIVGAVAGAGLVAFGPAAVNWGGTGAIAAGWIIAPLLSGVMAALLLAFIQLMVNEAPDRARAAMRWLPLMIAAMTALFMLYLGQLILALPVLPVLGTALFLAVLSAQWAAMTLRIELARQTGRKLVIKRMFSLPLLLAAALMGFAHGANDAANVAGPLTVILQGVKFAGEGADMPQFALLAAGVGIALGTVLFGGRLVRMVGSGITRLNPVRAFCISLTTAITVLGASGMGLPVSTTHVAIGGVFGVGFFREWHDRRRRKNRHAVPAEEYRRRLLIRRSYVISIVAAWIITVPAVAALAALVQYLSAGLLGP